jgi:hypothetical protein
LGQNIFSGNQVLARTQEMEDALKQRRLDSKSLDHFYTKQMGNFNYNILNHFLHYLPWSNGEYYMLRYAPSQEFKEGEITADIINQHLDEAAFKKAVILATRNGFQGQVTLKKMDLSYISYISYISLTSPSDCWAKLTGLSGLNSKAVLSPLNTAAYGTTWDQPQSYT